MSTASTPRLAEHPAPRFAAARPYLLIALVCWIASFFYCRRFGLYEDDWWVVGDTINWGLAELWENVRTVAVTWPQGRPVQIILGRVFSFLGIHAGGLTFAYLLCYAIVTLNACLLYRVVRRCYSETLGLVTALCFCVFPADTTHSFLHVAFCTQTSLTFVLLAALCYQGSRRWWWTAYLLLIAALLTYETCVLPFLAVPLLGAAWDRRLLRSLVGNAVVVCLILGAAVWVRMRLSEERVVGALSDPRQVVSKMIELVEVGPVASLKLFVTGPWTAVQMLATKQYFAAAGIKRWQVFAALAVMAAATGWVLCRMLPRRAPAPPDAPAGPWHLLARAAVVGVLMLVLSYPISLNRDPACTFGRLSTVHTAASLGGSLLAAACLVALATGLTALRLRPVAAVALTGYFVALAGLGLGIQRDYVLSWRLQRAFWQGVAQECPDLDEGTVILFNRPTRNTHYVEAFSWIDPSILEQVYAFPREWKEPPRAFSIDASWLVHLMAVGDLVWLKYAIPYLAPNGPLPQGNTILLLGIDGKLYRGSGTTDIAGRPMRLKDRTDPPALPYGIRPAYRLLMQ